MVKVLFVCSGNICRSPTAEGIFAELLRREGLEGRIETDSAGTHGYHAGECPDARAMAAARDRGIDLGHLRAREVSHDDFRRFDLVLAMDKGHFRQLKRLCPPGEERRLRMFMSFAPDYGAPEVFDPYYGGESGFDEVFEMCEAGSRGLLEHIKREWL